MLSVIRVLLVEDEDGDAEILTESLKGTLRYKLATSRVATLTEALECLKRDPVDVVLLDLSLPDATGLEALHALRAAHATIPVVILTGMDDELSALHALQDGAQDYLVKGHCDRELLARAVAYAIERQRAEHGVRSLAQEQQRRADDLALADRRKDEFLATLAHELRNPLAAIAGATTLLGVMRNDPAKFARLEEVLRRQGRHLARLIDDLLDVSRMTRNKIVLQREVCDLRAALDDALQARAAKIAGRGQRVAVRAASAVFVDGDSTRLNQILENLLDNASKYSPEGAEIRVSLATRESDGKKTAVVRVEDDGIGMDPAFLPRAFELFAQADGSLHRAPGGLGIGLSLVKHLAQLHGGDVVASSEGLGKGSAFELSLPSLPSSAGDVGEEKAPAAKQHVRRRVLIVEDNRDAADMLEEYLRHLGHDVVVAYDGTRGIEAAINGQFDLALIDVGLPGADGCQVAERIRASDRGEAMALVALTGYGAPEQQARVYAAGFDRHVLKPLDPQVLKELLVSLWPRTGSGTG